VPQFNKGDIVRSACGTGRYHSNPTRLTTMIGTQIQCSSLFAGLRWLSPYSASH
jgi:hypothetical protein